MIGLCKPQGSVSQYKSVKAAESFIPVCDTRSQNLELCSVMLPSPRRSFFMSSRASAGSSYGWKVFFESLHKLLVSSPARFVSFCFLAFFNLRLDELLFPDSSVSICQIGQDEGYLLFIVVVYQSVYFEVNINILHEQDEIASFPSKGFQWVKLDIFRGFWCRRCGCNGFGHSFFLLSVSVSVSFLGIKVSSIVESKSQGISWSRFCGVKVSGCTVKIQAHLLVSSHFC
jgi:hypothetical protein